MAAGLCDERSDTIEKRIRVRDGEERSDEWKIVVL
jgi:hypothetical protein